MEVLLNLVWLLTAIIAGAYVLLHRSRGGVVVATLCIVVLLFPIISVTDDLQSDAAVLEETSAVRRATLGVAQLVDHVAVPLPAAPQSLAIALVSCVRACEAAPLPIRHGFARSSTLRGPPTA
jgi:hypothetical protein